MRGVGFHLAWWPLLIAPLLSQALLSPLQAQTKSQTEPPAVSQPTATSPAEAPATQNQELSEKEKTLLQKINALKAPRWRSFGACRYDWSGWKLLSSGVRTTAVNCGPDTNANPTTSEQVAVHCDTLKLSIQNGDQAWSSWRLPYAANESKERGGEDLMVASLCANAKPIPKTQPAAPPAVSPTGKPAATKPTSTPATKKTTTAPAQKPPTAKP
ncbi:hypothetical protein [Vulcanococcus sp.]|jgi:hypothetical protein|uniref:hypothetical protein n=1 Tax=Vulcanococcus sp. TaxID=2856995 RepID=UPI0037D9F88E